MRELDAPVEGFTQWLGEHPEVLADAVGIAFDLRQVSADALVGTTTGSDRAVVVGTAFTDSTDAHVGRLIALAAEHAAATLVWVGPRLDDDRRAALDWINTSTDDGLRAFGVEVAFVRIGDSPPAPWLTVVTGPAQPASTSPADTPVDPTPDPLAYGEFWESCRQRISVEHPRWTRTRTAPTDAVFTTSTGLPGISLQMVAEPKGPQVRLLLDAPDPRLNAARFRRLAEAREAFEGTVDAPLTWRAPDTTIDDTTCIATRTDHLVDLSDPRTWPAMVSWLIQRQREFRMALEHTGPDVLGVAAS